MNLDYALLALGSVCLWLPGPLLCSTKVREKMRQPARRREEGLGSICRSPSNWIDLVRGGGGAWLVQHAATSIQAGQDELGTIFTVIQLAIFLIGVLAQTIWIGRPLRVIGPTFFLAGLTLVVSGPATGAFALTLGAVCALMIRRLSLSFVFIPLCIVGFSYLFQDMGIMSLFNAAAFGLPMFLAFAFDSRIAFARRPVDARPQTTRTLPTEVPETEGVEEEAIVRPDFTKPAAVLAEPIAGQFLAYEADADLDRLLRLPEPLPRKARFGLFSRTQR